MIGHAVVHRTLGVSLKSHVLNAHVASVRQWRLGEKREAIAALLFQGRQRVWLTEEAARCGRRRTLIDDNPTGG